LSNIIKKHHGFQHAQDGKKIGIQPVQFKIETVEECEVQKQRMREQAESEVQQAQTEAERIRFRAQKLLQEAEKTVEEKRKEWQVEYEQLLERAKQEGFEKGFFQGNQEAENQYKELLKEAEAMVHHVQDSYYQYIEQSEMVILELGMKVAKKILNIELEENEEKYIHVVQKAVKEVRDHKNIHIYISPKYYTLVSQRKEELSLLLSSDTSLFFYPSEDLGETDCMIESSFGKVNASIDSQLAEIKKRLVEMVKDEETI
jgi:flagellar assembly protein FliH